MLQQRHLNCYDLHFGTAVVFYRAMSPEERGPACARAVATAEAESQADAAAMVAAVQEHVEERKRAEAAAARAVEHARHRRQQQQQATWDARPDVQAVERATKELFQPFSPPPAEPTAADVPAAPSAIDQLHVAHDFRTFMDDHVPTKVRQGT